MAVGTLLLVFYYSLKIKGPVGWAHELVTAPFGMVKLSANGKIVRRMGWMNIQIECAFAEN